MQSGCWVKTGTEHYLKMAGCRRITYRLSIANRSLTEASIPGKGWSLEISGRFLHSSWKATLNCVLILSKKKPQNGYENLLCCSTVKKMSSIILINCFIEDFAQSISIYHVGVSCFLTYISFFIFLFSLSQNKDSNFQFSVK